MYKGKTKLILNYLGFLIEKYNMKFLFQSFSNYINGFAGPSDCYSFYNDYGCFTLVNIVQRDEWGWYLAPKISNNQEKLLDKEIHQKSYIGRSYFTTSGWLKALAKVILNEIELKKSIFSITIS